MQTKILRQMTTEQFSQLKAEVVRLRYPGTLPDGTPVGLTLKEIKSILGVR